MLPFYRALLHLYPAAYRYEYGDEMMDVLSEAKGETRQKNALTRIFFATREAGGLLSGALQEHLRSVTGSYDNRIFSLRRLGMKSEYRFPKTTVGLMMATLAGVMLAIEKARAISASILHGNPLASPIKSAQATVAQTMLGVLVWAIVSGAIGWAILFALRRTGVQQLSEMNPAANQRGSK